MPRPTATRFIIAASATVCAALAAYAALPRPQEPPPAPTPAPSTSPTPPAPPLITVPGAEKEPDAVAIERADVVIESVGVLTKTTVTLRFRNNTARILEGELAFPLPEGAALSGYALDVDGEMADAVPVPKDEARVIFETETRKGVDPGLVEQTLGNNFRTRIYPLPAKGTRTVRLSFTSEAQGGSGESVVTLPVRWNQTVPVMTVKVVSDAPATLTLGGKDRELVKEETPGSLTKTLENVLVNGDLTVRIRAAQGRAIRDGVMVETSTLRSGAVQTFFAVLEQSPAPNIAAPMVRTGATVGLIWDASLSRRSADIDRELTFLKTLAQTKWRDTTVNVTILRDRAESGGVFRIADGDASALIAFLRTQPFDGGTTYRRVFPVVPTPPTYYLLFSDGLETLGESGTAKASAPVWVINSDAASDTNKLRVMASASGGDLLNLSGDRAGDVATLQEKARTVGESPYSLLSVTVDDGKIEGLTVPGVSPVKAVNAVAVAGRLVSDTATVTLRYGFPGDAAPTATRTVTLRQPANAAPSSGLVGYLWAKRTADLLGVAPQKNRDALRQIGRDFGIVTPGSSLLVLETLAQALEYGVAPARTRKTLYAQYVAEVEKRGVAEQRETQDRTNDAVARWRKRVKHWNTAYKVAEGFRYKERNGNGGERARQVGSGSAPSVSGSASAPSPVSASEGEADSLAAPGGAQGFGGGAGSMREATVSAPRFRRGDAKAKSDNVTFTAPAATIAIKPWAPDAPYLKKMAASKTATAAYAVYLSEREPWAQTPAYYFDCAEALHRRGDTALAVRVLTGIADLRLEDVALLRIVAHRLMQWNHTADAVPVFEQITALRPEEPQSFRDLALALARRGDGAAKSNPVAAVADYNRALVLLNDVATKRWNRFQSISDLAITEANRIIARAKRLPASAAGKLVVPLDSRLVQNLDCDLRVVLTWDSDNSDMDLHVTEPTGEECFYGHNRTAIGGHLSDDFTGGYGPEDYFVRRGVGGKYTITTNYFASQEQKITGGTTVQATVYTDWGRPSERTQSLSLRLTTGKETVTVGDVTLAATVR